MGEVASIQLGLCCINTVLRAQDVFSSRSIVLKTFETKGIDYLKSKIIQNLTDVITMMEWNNKNGIHVFRLSSDIFPHMSNPRAPGYTYDFAKDLLLEIGKRSRLLNQRLTFHPGQYNCIGTPNETVFENTRVDLKYHADVLDLMELGSDSVIVVHGGGVYGDKTETKKRFIRQFHKLDLNVKKRLVLENCEKNFSIVDCLEISQEIGIPVVFDTHHFSCYRLLHPGENLERPEYFIPLVLETWRIRGIKPKFHVSEQGDGKCGHHSDYIDTIPKYLLDIPKLYNVKIDIMVEAKMKEQAIFRLYRKYYRELDIPFMIKFLGCSFC
jgi:UV DNA damage endonuclease